jgi:GTP-binding protein HflX
LEEVRKHRRVQRDRRVAQGVPTVALVGYTNAGKSSLLNALTGADALAEDKLFATLDPLVRRCALPGGGEALFADTVGFVRRLPHTLVAAFRATLEAVNEADLLLVVLDASHPAMDEHLRTVRSVLEEIGAAAIPFVKVYNKSDLLEEGSARVWPRTGRPTRLSPP